jgi:hypothetical protein
MLSAMGNLQPDRLLDPRFLDPGLLPDGAPARKSNEAELFPIFTES